MTRVVRMVGLGLLLVLASAACDRIEATPGYTASKAVLDSCGLADRELSGDLAADLVGGWRQTSSGAHPLTKLVTVPQNISFSEDGTGQIWWTSVGSTLADGDVYLFEWRVEDGHLVVDDLPSAEVVEKGPQSVFVRPPGDDSPTAAAVWTRCADSLEMPELTPEYRAAKTLVQNCQRVEFQLSGDLAADLTGPWMQSRPGDHPFTTLAPSPQVIEFRADGTGDIWWLAEDGYQGGVTAFGWRTENEHLLVDDLPPGDVRPNGEHSVKFGPVGATGSMTSTVWLRCPDALPLPAEG